MIKNYTGCFDPTLEPLKKKLDASLQVQKAPGTVPALKLKQTGQLKQIFSQPVEVLKGFELSAWKIAHGLHTLIRSFINEDVPFRCVGTAANYVLESDESYVNDILSSIGGKHFHLSKIDLNEFLDVDIKLKHAGLDYNTIRKVKAAFIGFLTKEARKSGSLATYGDIEAAINKKHCHLHPGNNPQGNAFMRLPVGDESIFALDFSFGDIFVREQLLSPDDVQIPFYIIKTGDDSFEISSLPENAKKIDDQKEKIKGFTACIDQIFPYGTRLCLTQTLFDRIYKIVHFPQLETMNQDGWIKLLQYYGKGYRAAQDEILLINKIETKNDFSSLLHRLEQFERGHYHHDKEALYCFYLNGIFSLHRKGQDKLALELLPILDKKLVKSPATPHLFTLIHQWFNANKEWKNVSDLSLLLQYCGLASMHTQGESGYIAKLTFNSEKPALQWVIKRDKKKSLTLMLPFDPNAAVLWAIENEKGKEIRDLLSGNRNYKGKGLSAIHPFLNGLGLDKYHWRKKASECINSTDVRLQQIGHLLVQLLETVEEDFSGLSIRNAVASFDWLLPVLKEEMRAQFFPWIERLLTALIDGKGDEKEIYENLAMIGEWNKKYPWMFQKYPAVLERGIQLISKKAKPKSLYNWKELQEQLLLHWAPLVDLTSHKQFLYEQLVSLKGIRLSDPLKEAVVKAIPGIFEACRSGKKWMDIFDWQGLLESHFLLVDYPEDVVVALLEACVDTLVEKKDEARFRKGWKLIEARVWTISSERSIFNFIAIINYWTTSRNNTESRLWLEMLKTRQHPLLHLAQRLYFQHAKVMASEKQLFELLMDDEWALVREEFNEITQAIAFDLVQVEALEPNSLSGQEFYSLMDRYAIYDSNTWATSMARLSEIPHAQALLRFADYLKHPLRRQDFLLFLYGWTSGIEALMRLRKLSAIEMMDKFAELFSEQDVPDYSLLLQLLLQVDDFSALSNEQIAIIEAMIPVPDSLAPFIELLIKMKQPKLYTKVCSECVTLFLEVSPSSRNLTLCIEALELSRELHLRGEELEKNIDCLVALIAKCDKDFAQFDRFFTFLARSEHPKYTDLALSIMVQRLQQADIESDKVNIEPDLYFNLVEGVVKNENSWKLHGILLLAHPAVRKLIEHRVSFELWDKMICEYFKDLAVAKDEQVTNFTNYLYLFAHVPAEVLTQTKVRKLVIDCLGTLMADEMHLGPTYVTLGLEVAFVQFSFAKTKNTKFCFSKTPIMYGEAKDVLLPGISTSATYFKQPDFNLALIPFYLEWIEKLTQLLKRFESLDNPKAYYLMSCIELRLQHLINAYRFVKNHHKEYSAEIYRAITDYLSVLWTTRKPFSVESRILNVGFPNLFDLAKKFLEKNEAELLETQRLYIALFSTDHTDVVTRGHNALNTQAKQRVFAWLVESMTNQKLGRIDGVYLIELINRFLNPLLKTDLTYLNEAVMVAVQCIFEYKDKLLDINDHTALLIALDKLMRDVSKVCQEAYDTKNPELMRKASRLLHTVSKRIYSLADKDVIVLNYDVTKVHPLITCIRTVNDLRGLVLANPVAGETLLQECPNAYFDFVQRVKVLMLENIGLILKKATTDKEFEAVEQLKSHFLVLVLANKMVLTDHAASIRSVAMAEFISYYAFLAPETSPYFTKLRESCSKLFDAALRLNLLQHVSADDLEKVRKLAKR